MTSNELFWLLLRDVGLPASLYAYVSGLSKSWLDTLGITLFFAGGFHLWRGVYSDVYWYSSVSCLGLGVILTVASLFFRRPVEAKCEEN